MILKLQIFPYTCLFTFFVTIIIFGELTGVTSTTSNERMTMDIIFTGATPNNQLKVRMPVSSVFAFACPVAQRYRQSNQSEKAKE